MLTDILLLGGGLICAYWALGAIFMVFKALFGDSKSKQEFNESKGLILIGGFLSALVALWLIPTSCENLFWESDDVYESSTYNPSFQGSNRKYEETHHDCDECSCDGYYG